MAYSPTPTIDKASSSRDEARTDAGQRRIVDAAIEVQQNSNTMSAVEYMRSRDVKSGVITRVLLEPARRRPTE